MNTLVVLNLYIIHKYSLYTLYTVQPCVVCCIHYIQHFYNFEHEDIYIE